MTLSASLLQHTLYAQTDAHTLVRVIFLILYPHAWEERIVASIGATIHFSNETWFVAPINTVNTFSPRLFNVPCDDNANLRAIQRREKNWRGRLLCVEITILRVYLYYITLFPTRFQRRISLFVFLFSFSFSLSNRLNLTNLSIIES